MVNTATRLVVAAAVVTGTCVASLITLRHRNAPEVVLPAWDFRSLPLQLGSWQGQEAELDPKIAARIGAAKGEDGEDKVVDRMYRSPMMGEVALHTAMFDVPDTGVYHSPMNCYLATGHHSTSQAMLELQADDETSVEVNYSIWEKEGKRTVVVYWFQIGEDLVFDRMQMAAVHWKLGGQPTWPALIKVLISTPASDDPERDRNRVRDFAERVYRWIQQAEQAEQGGPSEPPAK